MTSIMEIIKICLKELHDIACNIAKHPKHDGNQNRLAPMIYQFFNEKSSGSAIIHNQHPSD